jgi:hypothetical protein
MNKINTDIVYVLGINGNPLMPTKNKRSKQLLREQTVRVDP